MNYKSLPFQVKAMDDSTGSFEGYASVFGVLDRVGDVVVKGAFAQDLPRFLDEGVITWQHDWGTPIGRPSKAYEDERGLFVHGVISDTMCGRDARTLMKDGVVTKLSFGYDTLEAERLTPENIGSYIDLPSADPHALEQAFKWGYALKKLRIWEVSPVSIPAHPDADITGAKSGSGGRTVIDQSVGVLATLRDYSGRLKDIRDLRLEKGGDLSGEHRAALASLLDGMDQLGKDLRGLLTDPPAPVDQDAVRKAHADFLRLESRLIAGI